MQQYQLGLYEKSMPKTLPLSEKLRMAKACGFDYLELSIDETEEKLARLDWSDQEISRLHNEMCATGTYIGSICLSGHRKYPLGHPDPAVRGRSLEIMEKAIVLASKLGARVIQLAGYDVYYEPGTETTRVLFAEGLERCVAMASMYGVTLAFETMETEFLNTVEQGMYWVERLNSPYLQMYPDAGNITNAALTHGASVVQDLERGRGHLAALHLKESKPGVFREVPYGAGHVDFWAVVQTAQRLGVRRFLAEFWYTGQENWEADIRQNNKFLRSYLDDAFA